MSARTLEAPTCRYADRLGTGARTAVIDARAEGGGPPRDTQALIAEARQRQRDRRRRIAWLIPGAALAIAAVAASAIGLSSRGNSTAAPPQDWPLAAPTRPMPSQVVVWTGMFRLEVLSSRTGRVLRTLATNVGLYQGLPTISVSPTGAVYFANARNREQWIESIPLTGGSVTTIGVGIMPAISPNGRLLAYVTNTGRTIVVRNLATGVARRWSFASGVPAISSLSWSPDNRTLSYTSLHWPGLPQKPFDSTQLLDTRSGGTLTNAPRVRLARGLMWAGFLTARIGLAVKSYPSAHGAQEALVAVAVKSGRVLRRLIQLPRQGLSASNAYDGTEGAITIDRTGHYVLIAAYGPDGSGEIFRWTFGARHLFAVGRGAIRAAWP